MRDKAFKLRKEFQVQIDDIYACAGTCRGCSLSINERKIFKPAMSEHTLDKIFYRLEKYTNSIEVDEINITYGIADHLLMPDDYVPRLYKKAQSFLRAVGFDKKGLSSVLFTTSLVGKYEHVCDKLAKIKKSVESFDDSDIHLYPVIVFNPDLLDKKNFGEKYSDMIDFARDLYGGADFAINMSDQIIDRLTPEELIDFAKNHNFGEVTINWTPTEENFRATAINIEKLAEWLIGFSWKSIESKVDCGFNPVIGRIVELILKDREDDSFPTPMTRVVSYGGIRDTLSRSIQFDSDGNFFPKLEAIGDVAHCKLFGIKETGNVFEHDIKERLEEKWNEIEKNIVLIHSKSKSCIKCEYSDICIMTGFHVYNNVLSRTGLIDTSKDCPHIGKKLIKHFIERGITCDMT